MSFVWGLIWGVMSLLVMYLTKKFYIPYIIDSQKKKDSAKYTAQAFRMHSGELAKVQLQFKKHLIAPVIDKFGESLHMKAIGNDLYTVTVDVQVSKTFFGWLAQFGPDIYITKPERVREMYLEHLNTIVNCKENRLGE